MYKLFCSVNNDHITLLQSGDLYGIQEQKTGRYNKRYKIRQHRTGYLYSARQE